MKKVIIVGASGMVGGIILRECLASPEIKQVTSITRKPHRINHPKLHEIIHADFSSYAGLEQHFQQIDVAFFCIGAYSGQMPDDKFKMITVDFSNSFGKAVKVNSPNSTLCLLSGQGADPKEKSRIAFARYKGMAENYLKSLDFNALYIFRPGYIYPVEKRVEPNFSYRLFRKLYPLMKTFYSKGVITSEELAKAMFKAALDGADKMVLENMEIKAVLG